jgi:hypothetical protein
LTRRQINEDGNEDEDRMVEETDAEHEGGSKALHAGHGRHPSA